MRRKVPFPVPQIPPDWWSDLRRAEKANYSFDSLFFAFALAAPRMMGLSTTVSAVLAIMAATFFVVCFAYSQRASRHFG